MAGDGLEETGERSLDKETDMLADTSRYLPDLPPARVSAALGLPVALVLGAFMTGWETPSLLEGEGWLVQWLAVSVLVFAVPVWAGTLVTWAWTRALGGHSYLYRWSMLHVALLVVMGFVMIFGYVAYLVDAERVPRPEYFLFIYGVAAFFMHIFVIMTSTGRWVAALPATLTMPVLGMVGVLLAYGVLPDGGDLFHFGTLVVALLVAFMASGHSAIWIGTRSMARSYSIDGAAVFRSFLEHWVSGGDAGRRDIEDFFRTFSEPALVRAEVIAFRERGGGPIATVVVPQLHPGPWGELGGSDLPRKLAVPLEGKHGHVLAFHGASDHDLNPVDEEEVEKLGARIGEALDAMAGWTGRASRSFRVTDVTDALAQAFDGAVMAAQTSSPLPTDDVDYPVGFAIEKEMERVGAKVPAFIDCHNCLLPGAGHVSFGSAKAMRIQERIVEATGRALAGQRSGFRVGVGHVPNEGRSPSMGPTGVQTLVVEVDGQTTAWILCDGNNMEQGLRERIRDCALGKVDDAEVLTSDNHIVNVTVGGYNPIGLRDDPELLTRICSESLDLALADLREAEAAAARVEAPGVMVWGKGNTVRMTAHLNATIATSKVALLASVVVGLTVGFWAMWYL